MTDSPILNFALRGFQILFSVIVLGLSVTLAKHHHWGGLPATLGYVCFVGATSLLAAFIGLASTWVDVLQGKIGGIIDGFILLINLAGGVIAALKISGAKCTTGDSDENGWKLLNNDWMNGGCTSKSYKDCYNYIWEFPNGYIARCKESQADTVFMFLTVVVVLVSLTLTFLRLKKGY